MTQENRGVGPHPQPWPIGDMYDPELLASGDTRNVEDRYRYWTIDAIREDMKRRASTLHVAIENWQHDYNIGTIVRSANAFNAAAVHIIGRRHWNRRGAMVTDRYLEIIHHSTVDDFVAATADLHRIAIDNQAGAVALSETDLPKNAVLIFGGEGPGLSAEMIAASEKMLKIEQFGSTRSVNVGVAAGIVMYEWARRHLLS